MKRSIQADRLLRLLYRSGRLSELTRDELRMYLFLLVSTPDSTRPRRLRRPTLRRALRLSTGGVERTARRLQHRGLVRITRRAHLWTIELSPATGWR